MCDQDASPLPSLVTSALDLQTPTPVFYFVQIKSSKKSKAKADSVISSLTFFYYFWEWTSWHQARKCLISRNPVFSLAFSPSSVSLTFTLRVCKTSHSTTAFESSFQTLPIPLATNLTYCAIPNSLHCYSNDTGGEWWEGNRGGRGETKGYTYKTVSWQTLKTFLKRKKASLKDCKNE